VSDAHQREDLAILRNEAKAAFGLGNAWLRSGLQSDEDGI
jgi:hypothetical protein